MLPACVSLLPSLLLAPVQASSAAQHAPLRPVVRAEIRRAELAGRALGGYPFFEVAKTFLAGHSIEIAIDPLEFPALAGATVDLYLVAHKAPTQWMLDTALVDVRAAPQVITFGATDVASCTFVVDTGTLSGDAGTLFGVPYDVVIDADRNGQLTPGDVIDGLSEEAGFYVARAPEAAGPLTVTETLYTGGTFLGQDLYYPTDIATLGELPLVVVSHGNGHNYQWYDHIGYHLASWGYIVMSHQNNTMPGVATASTTTLTNTDFLLGSLTTIAGGALLGHVDTHRITWIGHSRGGEGVVRAYRRVLDGSYVPTHFTAQDIVLVSSIAPTVFADGSDSHPHGVNYHLWVGGADSDVNGCASCNQCQSFQLLGRATGNRQSISLHGAGHGAFHNGTGGLFAAGPCLLTRPQVHAIMKGYLVPLLAQYVHDNPAGEDFLWRQWEALRPDGAPTTDCAVVDLTYRRGPNASKRVIDDFQSQPEPGISSSGGAVTAVRMELRQDRLDDMDTAFALSGHDLMNGMTQAGATDSEAGLVFEWDEDRTLVFELLPELGDVRAFDVLSFRACQITRTANSVAELGDIELTVALRDRLGNASSIRTGVFGGGIEEPYQRSGCGAGLGWANEFETIRVRLADFTRGGTGLDLGEIEAIEFRFGPSHGSALGSLGLDDVELVSDGKDAR
ncbi:MAG: hypothetical protein ACKVWV_19450 [Planctomycetota bacterium]